MTFLSARGMAPNARGITWQDHPSRVQKKERRAPARARARESERNGCVRNLYSSRFTLALSESRKGLQRGLQFVTSLYIQLYITNYTSTISSAVRSNARLSINFSSQDINVLYIGQSRKGRRDDTVELVKHTRCTAAHVDSSRYANLL